MDHEKLSIIIEQHFAESPEVLEVCAYALSTLMVNDAVIAGLLTGAKEIRGISPNLIYKMKKFDNGLTTNKFWLENFAPIKMQLCMDDIKLNTMSEYIGFAETNPSEEPKLLALKQSRAILLSRCDVLTLIAFLWKGVSYAEDFDAKYRMVVQLTEEHQQYFSKMGI